MARVLLIAPTCDGTDVGEAWVAFQWARLLAEAHEVTLLTYHKRGRPPAAQQLHGLRVVEWTEPRLLGRAERLNSMLKPGYVAFHWRARRWIRHALASGESFDVVHQPVPVAMRYPCPATGTGLPVIIGPVGGGMASPPGFLADEGTTPWFVKLRAFDRLRLRRDPVLRRTYESAACVVGIAEYVAESLEGLRLRQFRVMSETAVTDLPTWDGRDTHEGPLRLLFVGRLIRTKGVRDAVRALARTTSDCTLDIVGDGPEREACEHLVHELDLGSRVTFHGRLERPAVMDHYERADVFLFPSYREPGGNVVFEAMSFGLPLIVCDRGGPAAAVDASCAVVLPAITPEQLAEDVAGAIDQLAADPARRLTMGRAARARLEETALWTKRIEQMSELYAEVVAGST